MNLSEFFKRKFLLARVSGIPVRADYRWFVVLAFVSVITANSISQMTENFLTSLFFGIFATFVFFASIFLHELAHGVVARLEGIGVVEIILHPFGGLTRLRHEPDTPRAEFRIAVAGPVMSFLLALLFLGAMALFNSLGATILGRLFFMLCLLNFLLAVFNLFPGYPLDGGRVLRAYLWRRGTNLNEATVLTGRFGQIIGVALVCFGIAAVLFSGQILNGFWSILVGLFLFDSAKSIIREVGESEKVAVEDAMAIPVAVAPDADVQHFVDHILPLHRQNFFAVAKDRQFYGILTLEDLRKLPPESWRETKIQTVMRAVTPDYFVEPGTQLADAKELMRTNGVGALGVIDTEGKLVGFLQSKNAARKRE